MSKLTKTAPTEIYLCISDESGDDDADFSAFDHEHTTWAEEAAVKNTVHYIREDLTGRQAPCKTHCEAQAFQIVIRRQHQALLAASNALIEASNAIKYYGPNPHQRGWQEDAQEAQDAAVKATAAAMSEAQPAYQPEERKLLNQLLSDEPLVSRLRSLERDHGPEGWPAVQMRDISALLDAAEAFARIVALYESEQDGNAHESRPGWVRRALRCIE